MLDNDVLLNVCSTEYAVVAPTYASLLASDEEGRELRAILTAYFKEYECGGMAKPVLSKERECTCCGEIGFVPKHHKYLCIFCWNHAGVASIDHTISTDRALDRVRINIPIGIEGTKVEPEVYYTQIYNRKNSTQKFLDSLVS